MMPTIFRWNVLHCVEMACISLSQQKTESARTCKKLSIKLPLMKKNAFELVRLLVGRVLRARAQGHLLAIAKRIRFMDSTL